MQLADINPSMDMICKSDLYARLIEEFERELNRPLTRKEKVFLNWVAEKQVSNSR